MRKIAEQQPNKQASGVSNVLTRLGFNLHLLGGERYVRQKLETLTAEQLTTLRETFVRNAHPRFMKESETCNHDAYGKKADYVQAINNANLTKIGKLIKITSVLLQSKTYLFWQD